MTRNYNTAQLSIKDTLLHIIWAEDSWINYSINDLDDPNRPFNFTKSNSQKKITDYNNKVISKVNTYLANLNDNDLLKIVNRIKMK